MQLSPWSPKIKIHDNGNNENNCMVVKVVPVVAMTEFIAHPADNVNFAGENVKRRGTANRRGTARRRAENARRHLCLGERNYSKR